MTTYPLSKTGQRQLAAAEATIERGLSTFIEVGQALALIRDGRLYREEHGTFEDYCKDRWGFTSRRARQFMEAAEIGTMVPIENERQARALAPLAADPDATRDAWEEASADGKPTAAKLAHAVHRRTTTETTTTTFDPETGEILSPTGDTATSGSDQSGVLSPDAAGPGDDEQEGTPAPSPAPKVAPPTTVCPTCGGTGEVEVAA